MCFKNGAVISKWNPWRLPANSVTPCQTKWQELTAHKEKNIAAAIELFAPSCECESHSISKYSIGPVDDDEVVYRLVTSPLDIIEGANTLNAGISRDLTFHGISTRRARAEEELHNEMVRFGKGLAKDLQKGQFYGYVRTKVSDIRALRDTTGLSRPCVYDDALCHDRRHAAIMMHARKAKKKEMELKVFKLFEKGFTRIGPK